MRVLIIGGTVFLGRAIVDALLARGHEPTIFHRGERGAKLFSNAERVLGDRARDLDKLDGRTFDAVVDTYGYVPAPVRASAAAFASRASRYLFVSSISVYDLTVRPLDESATLLELPPGESADESRLERYGELKVLCERAASEGFGADRTILLRPGLIVGPHDQSDRFSYWPARAARGSAMLAPGSPSDRVQFIDVRDLAKFAVELLEHKAIGPFNATSPRELFSMGEVVDTCIAEAKTDAKPIWASDEFLLEHEVGPWMELPLWIPAQPPDDGIYQAVVDRAIAHGLVFRPLAQTVRDTLAWLRTRASDHAWKAGLAEYRERELLRDFAEEVFIRRDERSDAVIVAENLGSSSWGEYLENRRRENVPDNFMADRGDGPAQERDLF